MRKRLTAALLCLCMMLTLLPSTAYAALGDLLGNSPGANQALLAELENLTGQDGQAVQALLEQYGLLDENGNLVTDQTVELDGVEYTLDEIEALLSDPATNLSQIGYVDGVPIALGDLATIIAIERELQRIQETYFSGRTFDGEALDNLNSLIDQIQAEGITVQSEGDGSTVSASGTKVSLDVSDFQELEFGLQYGLERSITSGTTDAYSYTLDVSYDPGLIGDVIDRIVVGAYDSTTPEGVEAGASVTLTEENPTGQFTYIYDSNAPNAVRSNRLRVYVYWKNPILYPYSHYSYGELAGSLTFSDPTGQMVFQNGSTYSDAHTLLLTTEREAPDLSKTSWTNPENTDRFENTWAASLDFPILDRSTDADRKTQVDRINDLITILQGAKGEPITEDNAVIYTVTGELSQSNSAEHRMVLRSSFSTQGEYTELRPEGDRVAVDPFFDSADVSVANGGSFAFKYSAWSATGENAVFSYIRVADPYRGAGTPGGQEGEGLYDWVENSIRDCTVTLNNDGESPVRMSVSAPTGTYYPGQVIPVTLTFDELVQVEDNTLITINGEKYTAEDLHMNTVGSRLVLWYRVLPADLTGLTVSVAVRDLWSNETEVNGETVPGVSITSTQRRSAVTDMEVKVEEGADQASTATVSITLNGAYNGAYLQDIQAYMQASGGELPFRVAVYSGSEVADYLPIRQQEDDSFATDPYEIPAGMGSANWYHAILQVNEGTAESPVWTELPWWDESFSSGAIHAVTSVTVHARTDYNESYTYTINASDQSTWPTVWANLYTGTGEDPTYTTGYWTCETVSGDAKATFAPVAEDPAHPGGYAYSKIQPSGSGWIRCTFTADNGTENTSDDVTSETYREFYVTPGTASYLGFASDTVTTQRYAALTLSWGSNLGSFLDGEETLAYTVQLYRGDFTGENAVLDETALVATYETGQTASVQIPAGVLSEMPATSGAVAYTVVVSAPDTQNEGNTLTDRVGIILESQPVTARLIRPADLYITDDVESVDIDWELEGLAEGQQATFTIQRVRATDNSLETVASIPVSTTTGTYTLHPSEVSGEVQGSVVYQGLKDTYQVTLTVDNGDQAPSTDAFALHVYNSDGLWLVDENGNRIDGSSILMNNSGTVMNYGAGSPTDGDTYTETVLALRQQLGLLEYIGVNYDAYTWNSFRDGIRWATDNDAISVNYKQGGLYENIENFSYDTYLPELLMGISTTEGGSATITATHAATGMSASVEVHASTLKDKFYLFQVTPAAETTLRYNDGDGWANEVKTNKDGVLALYEPTGIASDVQLSSVYNGEEYLGTIQQEELLSGEGDATKLQLYPLNAVRLREAAKVELTLVKPDGSPLAGSPVTVRGGVFKNGLFCTNAGLGTDRNSSFNNAGATQRPSGTEFDTDENGKITVYFNADQFTTETDSTAGLLPSDQIEYVLEITGIDGDKYYPLFQTVDGTVSPLKEMQTAASVVVLEAVPQGEKNKPFIAQQTVTYYDAEGQASQTMDVRRSTGSVGPNSTFPTAELNTVVLLWGEKRSSDYDMNNYQTLLVDENGYQPSGGDFNRETYPFASITVVEHIQGLSAATMTDAGWVDTAEEVGLKLRLNQLEGEGDNRTWTLLREITLPFRAVDLTKVTPVDKDKNVTGMLLTMSEASALEQATQAFTTDVTGDKVAGELASGLMNLTGGIDGSVFKMLVTPTDDPTVFNALIWAGYDDLELADADYSEDGVAVSLYSGEFDVGLPSREKVSDMARGAYLPASVSTKHQVALDSTGADLKLQLEGFYEAEIRYDRDEGWKVYTKGGGFTAGAGVEFGFDVNAFVGPVPVTGSFRVGGAVQLSFQTALRYDQGDEPVNDFLTNLRLQAYVNAFGGFGFDYAIVALKIGLFGELSVDSQNQFLTRAADEDLQGQKLTLGSQVGIKFVAQFLFISYEAVLASVSYSKDWTYSGWDAIEKYWDGTGTGLSIQSLQYAAAANGLDVASASVTLQSRDYLNQYARTWGDTQARAALLSLDKDNGLANLQTNANPASFPEISDDGQLLTYISDSNKSSIYDSRAHFSTLRGGSYGASTEITGPDDFSGHGDSDVDIAGTGTFAAAAWVRLSDRLLQDAGEEVSPEEQNTLMNGAEIVASVYQDGTWTSTRLTNDSAPDLAPAVAANGNHAIVFWRSAVSNAESTGDANALLDFDARDCIMYSVYDNGSWGEPRMLYNGSNGAVKALQAAMLPDGTAVAVYTLDRSEAAPSEFDKTKGESGYEIAYTIVGSDGELGTTMLATSDTWLDENPQVVTADFDSGDDRFVIGWHSLQDGESNIQILAVDENGAMSNDFPASLTALVRDGSAAINGDFRLAAMNQNDGIENLTILWSETVEDGTDADGNLVAAHSELKAAKLLRSSADSNYRLSAPLEVAVLPANNLVNHFSAYLDSNGQVKAVIQATRYSNDDQKVIFLEDSDGNPILMENGTQATITIPSEETRLYTATSQFEGYAVEVDAIGVDYENLALDRLTPIQFQIRNTGLKPVSSLTVTMGSTAETASLTDSLQPGESATLTVMHQVDENTVTNPAYTISGTELTANLTGTVYLDYPDVGISQMEVLKEEQGKRTIAVTLYNASAAALAGKDRTVQLEFYTDNLLTEKAPVTLSAPGTGISVTDNTTITISGEDNLARIDDGTFTLTLTYDVGSYVKDTYGENAEIPDSGVYLYADAWAEGKVGEQGDLQRLPEYHDADNQAAVLLTGAYARTGHQYTSLDVEQETDSSGHTAAAVTLTNNSLYPRTVDRLIAVLVNEQGEPLESQIVDTPTEFTTGETSATQPVTFSQTGQRVLVYSLVLDEDLFFEGLPITPEDFLRSGTDDHFEYTYQLRESDSATNLLITAYSTDGVTINGTDLGIGGSESVSLDPLVGQGTDPITVEIQLGGAHYTLNLLPEDYGVTYAEEPTIITQPQDAAYPLNGTAESLTVEARVSDGGTLSYQWYQNATHSDSGLGRAEIPGATGPTYTPPTTRPGTIYYFCQVTNTLSGETAFEISEIASVTVTEVGTEEYIITFDAAGGVCSVASAVTAGGKLSSLPTPTREGYTFDGWFTAASGGTEVTTSTAFTGDGTVYARWTQTGGGEDPGGEETGGNSGGGTASYQITVEDASNGEVTANRRTASEGSTVTLTVTPDEGYQLADLTVTDRNGKEIPLDRQEDGRYTFTMPGSTVTVEASFVPAADQPFVDVPASAYYYDAVNWAVSSGITNGTTETTFSPNNACTRAQMVTFLWRSAGAPQPESGVNPFTDVADTAYYYDAVLWAVEQGITNGTTATTFSPNATVTRGQTVAFLWRYAGSPEAGGSSFTDVAADAYYATAVAWAAEEGITSGTTATTFNPHDPCTRAQIVTFLYRAQ